MCDSWRKHLCMEQLHFCSALPLYGLLGTVVGLLGKPTPHSRNGKNFDPAQPKNKKQNKAGEINVFIEIESILLGPIYPKCCHFNLQATCNYEEDILPSGFFFFFFFTLSISQFRPAIFKCSRATWGQRLLYRPVRLRCQTSPEPHWPIQ